MSFRIFTATLLLVFLSACSTIEPLIVYDANGRVIKKTDKETGEVTEWEYADKGMVSRTEIPEGIVRHFYNSRDLLIKVERQPDDIVWHFEYTTDGKLKAIKDPAGNVTMYVYDKDSKLIEKILPDGTIEIDPKTPASPMVLMQPKKHEYDKPGRPEKIQYQSSVNTYKMP
jgi:YD repeat-containing protein